MDRTIFVRRLLQQGKIHRSESAWMAKSGGRWCGGSSGVARGLAQLAFMLLCSAYGSFAFAGPGPSTEASQLWARDNLVPWVVNVDDAKRLTPEERAQMLEKLGFKRFAYFWEPDERSISVVDQEISALQRHHIDLTAWWFSYSADDPFAKALLESFRLHHVRPQLWLSPTYRDREIAIKNRLPKGIAMPGALTKEGYAKLSVAEQEAIGKVYAEVTNEYLKNTYAATPKEQERRVEQEAGRVAAVAKLAAPYGNVVGLYNHGGWSGIESNLIAVLERLRQRGVHGVGIVYAFNHARDRMHDDTRNFPALWMQIKPYVIAVVLHGTSWDDGAYPYLSQGDHEVDMMRTIQASGWRGPVALYSGKPGVPDETLRNTLIGLNWVVAELNRPGSGGPRPFPPIPLSTSQSSLSSAVPSR